MMKFIQILFLWLAGFTLLGHSIVPHHHHNDIEQICSHEAPPKCSHEHNSEHHNHLADTKTADNCINHQHEHEEACTLHVNTYIEHQQNTFYAVLNSIQKYSFQNEISFTYDTSNSGKTNSCLGHQHHGRAPPILS